MQGQPSRLPATWQAHGRKSIGLCPCGCANGIIPRFIVMGSPINWLDAVIILALIAGMFVGFWQGLIRQAVTLGAFYIAAVLSTRLYPNVSDLLLKVAHGMVPFVADVVGFFILLFVIGLVAVFLTMDTLRKVTERPVGALGRVGGGVCGLIFTAVFISLTLVALNFATLNPWPASSEPARQTLVEAHQSSNLVLVFRQLNPVVMQSIRFWGGSLPPMFASDFGV
jgi:uncharacterized membrane protein required for colicin V production